MNEKEKRLSQALYEAAMTAKNELKYNPQYFLQMFGDAGGLKTAKKLLAANAISDGFTRLFMLGRLDLTIEAIILREDWISLFTDVEIQIAEKRLKDANFNYTKYKSETNSERQADPQPANVDAVTQAILDVLQNYLLTKASLEGKAIKSGTPDQQSLEVVLPKFFLSVLGKLGRSDEFKVEGSFGAGQIAGVPWVGIFNRGITESAQNGYYIVLLFSEDMGSCFLSLNQGVTAFEKEYSRKVALQKMKEAGERALRYFSPDTSAIIGQINLSATRHLGQGYQRGAIESFCYEKANSPSGALLEKHFLVLLDHYDTLAAIAGPTLQSLAPVTEDQYQQAVLEKAASDITDNNGSYVEPPGGMPVPPKKNGGGSGGYQRNPAVAASALRQASFKCEISASHETFISSAKNQPYVEAHHLIPLSRQGGYGVSLDVTANVIALCPMCHKRLHHGKAADKKTFLKQLFLGRKERLIEKEILLDEKTLLGYYNDDLLDEEA